MGLIFDKIDAEVAAREGLIAAAGVGRLHLLPMRDRSLIEKRTRNIRAIRNDAAAKLGVLPSFEVQKFGQTFRVDFHKPNKAGWGFIGPRGVHQIYASATNLSTGKVHIWNGARKERLQCPNMPTGIRTARVIGTDAQGEPIYEIEENPLQAALDHFRHAALLGITEEPATDKTPEWGNTTTTVYADSDDGCLKNTSVADTWANLIGAAAATNAYSTSTLYHAVTIDTSATTDRFDYIFRCSLPFDTSAIGAGTVSSATLSVEPGTIYSTASDDSFDVVAHSRDTPGTLAVGDYDNFGSTLFGQVASIHGMSTGAYTDITLNAAGIAAIDGSGTTVFGAVAGSDRTATPPTWVSGALTGVRIYYADQAGTSSDPKLVLEYAPAAAAASGGSMISPLNLISRLGR